MTTILQGAQLMVSHDVYLINTDKDLQILHFHKILNSINIVYQVLTLEYGKDCASHDN
jgi:hypothetical protein